MKAHSDVLAFFLPRLMIARRVVIDRLEIILHEFGHCERLADVTPFRQMEMSLAPGDVELSAGQCALPSCLYSHGGGPLGSTVPGRRRLRLGARAIAPRRRGPRQPRQAPGDPPVRGAQAVLRLRLLVLLRLLSRLKILRDGALLHDGGCIGGQERRIFVGEMAWLDAPDRGDEGRALGFGEAWRRLKTMASRFDRCSRSGGFAWH
jgi:hypothetical protein